MSEAKDYGLCGEDEYGGNERDLLIYEAAQRGWQASRNRILYLLYYLLCTHVVRRVHKERLDRIGLDHDAILSSAHGHLERAMDNKQGLVNGPFNSFTDKVAILRSCWGYIAYCTMSAVRDLGRAYGNTKQLEELGDVAASGIASASNNAFLQIAEMYIPCLTETQQELIAAIRQGMTQAEFARKKGISEPAVTKLKDRAVNRLKKLIHEGRGKDEP